jgi:hypothetical protein
MRNELYFVRLVLGSEDVFEYRCVPCLSNGWESQSSFTQTDRVPMDHYGPLLCDRCNRVLLEASAVAARQNGQRVVREHVAATFEERGSELRNGALRLLGDAVSLLSDAVNALAKELDGRR